MALSLSTGFYLPAQPPEPHYIKIVFASNSFIVISIFKHAFSRSVNEGPIACITIPNTNNLSDLGDIYTYLKTLPEFTGATDC